MQSLKNSLTAVVKYLLAVNGINAKKLKTNYSKITLLFKIRIQHFLNRNIGVCR